jgi:hypothetical protein
LAPAKRSAVVVVWLAVVCVLNFMVFV